MADRILARLKGKLAGLPELRNWTIKVFRDPDGRIACTVTHRLGSYHYGTGGLDNEEGLGFIIQAIKTSPLIAGLNAAPDTGDPQLMNGLRSGKLDYGWSESKFDDLLAVFQSTGRIGAREADWLRAVSRIDAYLWPRAGRLANQNSGAGKPAGRGHGSSAPAVIDPILSYGRMSVDDEAAAIQQHVTDLPSLRRQWSVRVLRSPDNGFICILGHPLMGREVRFAVDDLRVDSAVRTIKKWIRTNAEIASIDAAPSSSQDEAELLGELREHARQREWSPIFFFQILETLRGADLISGEQLIWAMEAGPAGDPHWRHQLDGAAREEYEAWRLSELPDWMSVYSSRARKSRPRARGSQKRADVRSEPK